MERTLLNNLIRYFENKTKSEKASEEDKYLLNELKYEKKWFSVLSLCRDDLAGLCKNPEKISDRTMQDLAEEVGARLADFSNTLADTVLFCSSYLNEIKLDLDDVKLGNRRDV